MKPIIIEPKQIVYPLFFKTLSQSEIFLKFCVNVPCIIVWLIIIFIYVSYSIIYLYPLITNSYPYETHSESPLPIFKTLINLDKRLFQEQNVPNKTKRGWILCFGIHYLLFWFIFSMIRTIFTDPGQIPSPWANKIEVIADDYNNITIETLRKRHKIERNSPLIKDSVYPLNSIESPCDIGSIGSNEFLKEENEAIKKEALDIVMGIGIFRYCQYCISFKPLRTHHCRQCRRCVLKMDHHCQWILTCIGLYNYKYFMNMLFYGVLTLLFVVLSFTRCVADVALNPDIEGKRVYWVLLLYVMALLLLLIISGFLGFHLWLIYKGKTTLEYFEKSRKEGKMKKTHLIDYNEGFFQNFINIFDKNPLLWCFPIGRNEKINGLYEDYENPMICLIGAEFSSENHF